MIDRIDENFNLHAKKIIGLTDGMEVYNTANLTYVDSNLACDTFNIIHITNGEALLLTELELAIQHFKKKESEYCIWINSKNFDPTKQILTRLSLDRQNEEVGMSLNLDRYSFIHAPDHENIRVVSNKKQLHEYAMVIAENWEPLDQDVLRYYDKTRAHYLNPANKIILLLYYVANKVVSSLELFPSDHGIIGIYGFSTKKAYRKQGIGSAMMTYALNLAKQEGYKNIILQATEAGVGIYKQYGFEAQTMYYEYV